MNVGAFKLPLYKIPTNPNLSVNDIPTLTPISGFICLRLSIIGDSISQMNSDMHPSEYLLPLIHQRGMPYQKALPEVNPTVDPPSMQKDPFYSNLGMLLYLHFLKNFPKKPRGKAKLR